MKNADFYRNMTRIMRLQSIAFYIYLFLMTLGLTACHHKHKPSDNSTVINEMPLPDINKNYSPELIQKEVIGDGEKIYQVIEQMPQFPGGEGELMNFISTKLKYPVSAKRNGIQGKVICRFIITRTGIVEKAEVVRSLDPQCDKEALRVIRSIPQFIPGKQNGVNVNVYYTIPITFRLE